jgi:hypothetical protein
MANLIEAIAVLKSPVETLEKLGEKRQLHALSFLLTIGAITALLTPLQISMGFEDVNGLHAGGQAEYLARDISVIYNLGNEYHPLLVEAFYVFVLLLSTCYLHVIFRFAGGNGTISDTFKMIAYGDTPALLFGWVSYFATIAALWAAVIQLLIGPVVVHKLSWANAIVIFSVLVGIGIIEIAMS